MKKTNNQGFSLVELIIVIAIMAVLVGVLAPQFIKYVEKSRVAKDATAVEELRNAVEVALTEDVVYTEMAALLPLNTSSFTISISPVGVVTYSTAVPKLAAELASTVELPLKFGSKLYMNTTSGGATITISAVDGNFKVVSDTP